MVTAATISATASLKASKHARQTHTEVTTPDNVPDIGQLVQEVFDETKRQSEAIAAINAKLEKHLGWHEGRADAEPTE